MAVLLTPLSAEAALAGTNAPAQPRADVPPAVERLWSEYPLNPGGERRDERPPRPQEPDRAPAAERPPTPAAEDSSGIAWSAFVAAAVATAAALALAVAVVLRSDRVSAAAAGMRRRFAIPSARASGTAARRDGRGYPTIGGGQVMSYLRRARRSDRDDATESADAVETHDLSAKVAAYSGGASAQTDAGASADPGAGAEVASAPRDAPAVEHTARDPYEQVGEHVAAVLSSAQEAADRVIASATEEAAQIRTEADDYAETTRGEADAYAEERRRAAEEQATAIVSDAETRAKSMRESAKAEADQIQQSAVERRESLLEEVAGAEERLRSLLQVFRAMSARLETLVGADGSNGNDGAAHEPGSDATAAEELRDALLPDAPSRRERARARGG